MLSLICAEQVQVQYAVHGEGNPPPILYKKAKREFGTPGLRLIESTVY